MTLFIGLLSLALFPLSTAVLSGCDEKALISGSEHHVENSQLTASSSDPGWNHGPTRSRLNTWQVPETKRVGAWCSYGAGGWIQADFKKVMFVTGVATRGRPGQWEQWMTGYVITYSTNGLTWTTYPKTFRGNFDAYSIVRHQLERPIVARFVRLRHKSGNWCTRWELYGCPLSERHCPPGFSHSFTHGTPTYIVSKPYQPSCYRFVTGQKNWPEARSECRKIGGDLVSVETAGEQHHLETIIHANPALQKPALTESRHWGYWAGGTDEPKEGAWVWAATGRAISYTNWISGAPNNKYQGDLAENCLTLSQRYSYKWNDIVCFHPFLSYICETPALAK